MNATEFFKAQIEKGATEMFFYGLERAEPHTISIMRHKGSLDTFPTNLEFIRMMTESNPLFREVV
jgi:hypothetical protein